MSTRELKEMKKLKWADKSVAELRAEIRKHKDKSFDLRMDAVSGKMENFRDVLLTRRRIARLLTLIRQQELAGAGKETK